MQYRFQTNIAALGLRQQKDLMSEFKLGITYEAGSNELEPHFELLNR
jgi:hypothetical protein